VKEEKFRNFKICAFFLEFKKICPMNRDHENLLAGGSQLVDLRRTGAIPRRIEQQSEPIYEYLPSNFQRTVDRINGGERVCVVLRGLPGSGKSYIAKALVSSTVKSSNPNDHIISADDFFLQNGRYQYDVSKLSQAHQFAQQLFCKRASLGYSPLIVDNTNKEYWEMSFYIKVAIQNQYHIEIMMPVTPWSWNANRLAQKNKHSVPMDKINFMKDMFETGATVQEIAKSFNLALPKKPAQRNIPPYHPTAAVVDAVKHDKLDQSTSVDINKNPASQEPSTSKAAAAAAAPLSWNSFQQQQQEHVKTTGSLFQASEVKQHVQKNGENNNWSPTDQFEENWDQPLDRMEEKPQEKQQRKVKKDPSPDSSSLPHRRDCPNEAPEFANLREMYPNVKDSHLWDLFLKTSCNIEWCANLLCDDSSLENMTGSADDLRCDCALSDGNVSQARKANVMTEFKKQTPVKTKKAKTKPNADELMAAKCAIEDSIRFGECVQNIVDSVAIK
jgi:predicted kinase